jgi:S1-C subfamily serine protease
MVSCVGSAWRTWRGSRIDSLLRLDIAPYPGLSGGAVIAADGSLLGLATTGLTKTGAVAIPLATARRVAEDLLTRGRVVRPFLGVALQPVNIPADIRGRAGIDGEHGLIVMGVEPGSPAHQSGMLIGDIIVAIRDSRIRGIQDVQTVIETAGSGTDVRVDVIRAGSPTAVMITLRDRPDGSA